MTRSTSDALAISASMGAPFAVAGEAAGAGACAGAGGGGGATDCGDAAFRSCMLSPPGERGASPPSQGSRRTEEES